jgi:hypothetical protein
MAGMLNSSFVSPAGALLFEVKQVQLQLLKQRT